MASTTGTSIGNAVAAGSRSSGPDYPQQDAEWRFVVLSKGRPLLHTFSVKRGQTGATIMHLLRKEYAEMKLDGQWFHRKLQVEDAIISPLCIGDLEAQDYPREVIIQTSTPRPDLVDAFHNPSLLRGSDFVRKHEQFCITAHADRPCHAILIKKAASKYKIMGALTVVIMFSIVVGIVSGFLAKDAKIGLVASGVAVGTFALAQASLFGADSMRSHRSS